MLISIVIPDEVMSKVEELITRFKNSPRSSYSERLFLAITKELYALPDPKLFNMLRDSYINRLSGMASKQIEKPNRTTVINHLLDIAFEHYEDEYRYSLPEFKEKLQALKPRVIPK